MINLKKIKEIEEVLSDYGFTKEDYVISLQGPTVILSVNGKEKMERTLPLKADLMSMRVQIM